MKYISKIQKRWQGRKEQQFLKEHGCRSQEQYNRRFDSDVSRSVRTVNQFYHGYANFDFVSDNVGYTELNEWCKTHCKGKWRLDIHRVVEHNSIWEFNDIGGTDMLFAAFKNSEDYVLWYLRK